MGALEKADSKTVDQIAEIGKLLKKPSLVYRMASEEKKVLLVKSLVENFSWSEGALITNWLKPYKVISQRPIKQAGSGPSYRCKTFLALANEVYHRLTDVRVRAEITE